jgi:uncharacterized circularly permuted ATP-grasp superfamily protein
MAWTHSLGAVQVGFEIVETKDMVVEGTKGDKPW